MGWAFVYIFVVLLLLDLLLHLYSAKVALPFFESKPPFGVKLSPPHPHAEPIAFPTTHDLTLRGSLLRQTGRPSRGLIIFCPELGGNHWSALSYCRGLWEAGFDILAFDFRNQGESDCLPGYEPLHWLTEYEVSDALAAIAYTQRREDLREMPLGIFGISRGGSAALASAARNPVVQRIACDGAFSTECMLLHYTRRWATLYAQEWLVDLVPDWHLRITLTLVRWTSQVRKGCRYTNLERLLPLIEDRPVQLISGERDTYVLPEMTKHLCRKMGASCQEAWIVPGAKHNLAQQVQPEEYDRRLVEFFDGLSFSENADADSRRIEEEAEKAESIAQRNTLYRQSETVKRSHL